MQILASALPGFRDLRAPLVAGYMWLLFAWLLLEPNLDVRPHSGPGAAFFDLTHELNRLEIALAVGVAAYLIGSVSQSVSTGMRFVWSFTPLNAMSGGFRIYPQDQILEIRQKGERKLEAVSNEGEIAPIDLTRLQSELAQRADEAERELYRELDLPAVLLVGEKSELFAEVDRLRAEGELRLAVIPPLLALTALLTISGSLWWLSTLPAIAVLFVQGVRKEVDARKGIADALSYGRIPSSSAAKFDQWVEKLLS